MNTVSLDQGNLSPTRNIMKILACVVAVEERGFCPNDKVLDVGLHVDPHAYSCLMRHR